jgi:hypothetical protein
MRKQRSRAFFGIVNSVLFLLAAIASARAAEMPRIGLSEDKSGFITQPGGEKFVPWGFNYDHDESGEGRLIEDYWHDEWDKVVADFQEMKALGANVVRVHLQFGKFMAAPGKPNARELDQLGRLLKLAEETGLYLDLTGLGCYHKKDVPAWYDALEEADRWQAQAEFWEAIAQRCQASPAVFCYDLMNEPVVPGGDEKQPGWLVNFALGGKFFVQYITRERAGPDGAARQRGEIAGQWIRRLTEAIRQHDQRRLITVGLIPNPPQAPGRLSGFEPRDIVEAIDFFAIHVYPHTGKLDEALQTVRGFAVGKPVIVEEMFPLHCTADELGQFIDRSQGTAAGWIGFYWGRTPVEYRGSEKLGDVLTLKWLDLFQAKRRDVLGQGP